VVHPPFELVLNQTARLDFRMQLAVLNQTVEVQGERLHCLTRIPCNWEP
jgi:hypothetical protein